MFSSTQFESGGGFTFSQSTQPSDSGPSPGKAREIQGLTPLTVKQISEASHSGDDKSNFVIDGVDVTIVTMVGMVFDKTQRVTDFGFTLDDGTGRIECKRWVNESSERKEMEEIQDGMYVRLIGHLKSFQGARHLVAFSLRPVTNFDEITFHFIDCIHFHLQKSRVQLQGDSQTQPQTVNSASSNLLFNGSNGQQTNQPNQFSSQVSMDGLKGCDQMVLEYLRNDTKEKGVHRDELSQQLKIPAQKIMESIKSLEDEGLIYSTIDDYHFKST